MAGDTQRCVRRPLNFAAWAEASAGGRTPSSTPSKVMAGTQMAGCAARRDSIPAYAGSPETRPKRWRYEWITTSTKSGLSNAAALRSKVASSNAQVGDHDCHSRRARARRSFARPAAPRAL
ncbi:hypothetical protein AVHY2522_22155 [Acidovorax sp. SUPP2522]|nr:hypothetical protein AVHY2522_22155 [Acidovorax sp. SUPP2522]